MGQTEAPLTIRPFLPDLTQSELMTVMTSGMAHVSGGIMAAYIAFGVEAQASAERGDHDRAGHDPDGEDAGAGDGSAEDRRARGESEEEVESEKKENLWVRLRAERPTVWASRLIWPRC